jgi:hypothetical protein
MATEGIKTLKFANRVTAIQYSTIVALITVAGKIRSEYVSGSENYNTVGDYWYYNFLILEEDIPSGLTFDQITESIFVPPFVEVWATRPACATECVPITTTETVTELPDYIQGLDVQEELVDGATVACEVKMTTQEFATLITPLLDIDALVQQICPACECGSQFCTYASTATVVLTGANAFSAIGTQILTYDETSGRFQIDTGGGAGWYLQEYIGAQAGLWEVHDLADTTLIGTITAANTNVCDPVGDYGPSGTEGDLTVAWPV